MKYTIILLLFSCALWGQNEKTIIIKTDKSVDLTKIKIYLTKEYQHYKLPVAEWQIKKINKTAFSFTTDESYIFIEYEGQVPYEFNNIQNITGDTVIIDKLKLIKYSSADTIYTSVTKYKRDSTFASTKSYKKIFKKGDINTLIPPPILINKDLVIGIRKVDTFKTESNACTPYKIAIEETMTSTEVLFIYK